MNSIKLEIGNELKLHLQEKSDVVLISRWAYEKYINNLNVEDRLQQILFKLSLMEDDPQFEISEKKLYDIANNLILEGEQEEFGRSLPEVKEAATHLDESWLMCPLCQEAWETNSKYPMVRCPKCQNLLHNPLGT